MNMLFYLHVSCYLMQRLQPHDSALTSLVMQSMLVTYNLPVETKKNSHKCIHQLRYLYLNYIYHLQAAVHQRYFLLS